jgi:hypothetical protein
MAAEKRDFVGELDECAAALDAKSIDLLSRHIVMAAARTGETIEGVLTDFLTHTLGSSDLPREVKIHAVVIVYKALDVARMIVAADVRKGAGNVQ